MRTMRTSVAVLSIGVVAALAGPVTGAAAKFKRLFTANASTGQSVAMTRTPNGSLHLVFQTFAGRAFSGLGAMSISKAGAPGPQVQALASWQTSQPGLIAQAGGTLQAIFGAISPASGSSSVWGITSSNGGATWSSPFDVRAGGPNEALAYGSDITAATSPAGPVLSLPQAGNIVIQRGLGSGSPNYQLTNSSDGSTTTADLAVDAATGRVVAGWPSIAGSSMIDYLQAASPTVGPVQAVPGQSRNALIPAGRDKGAGVFAAYTTDGTHVRLLRYGGGSIAVGSRKGTTAKALGTATGIDGRIWVMWGDDSGGGVVVTRSNKAVTRFEPLQQLNPSAFTLYRVSGDGRLGPLDLLVNEIPISKGSVPPPGEFYARVLPELSASVAVKPVKNGKGQVIAHALKVTVTDAGDAVSGATASCKGQKNKTNNKGVTTLVIGGKGGFVQVTIAAPSYQVLKKTVKL